MTANFMLEDLLRVSEAVILFSPILLAPGYVLCRLAGVFGFRERSLAARLAIAIPASIGLCPVVSYLLLRFLPPAVWIFYGVCAIASAGLAFADRRTLFRAFPKRDRIFVLVATGWATLAILALVDLQIGHRLYFSEVSYDYALRTAFTASIGRTGVPPHNPYFFPGHPVTLRYHYFWYILCSLVQRIGGPGISSRQAIIAGAVWSGAGLICLIALYLRFFQSEGRLKVRRRTLIAIALLGITGLDILPALLLESSLGSFLGSTDWWNDQITSWVATLLWVPHHLAGLIACLMGFLLVWDASGLKNRPRRIAIALVAGAMFAGAVGLTIYVTLVFAVCAGVWTVVALLTNRRRQAGLLALSGLTAVLLSGPYLAELFHPATTATAATGHGLPLMLWVKPLWMFDILLKLTAADGWKFQLANLLAMPLNYFLELGFFLIAGVLQTRRLCRAGWKMTDSQLCGLTMGATSLVFCSSVRSSIIGSNDLGWRGFLIAQFILLLWGAELLNDAFLSNNAPAGPGLKLTIALTLALGAAGSAYELVKIRFNPLLSDLTPAARNYKWLAPDAKLGSRTYALRQLYEELKTRTLPGAILQHNPNSDPQDFFNGLYGDRQVAAETMNCAVVFGGDARLCDDRIATIDDLFEKPAAFNAGQIDGICTRLSISVLIVKDTDATWKDPKSWAWNRQPAASNSYARAFACGAGTPVTPELRASTDRTRSPAGSRATIASDTSRPQPPAANRKP